MNCDWKQWGEPNERGEKRYACTRKCTNRTGFTLHPPENITANCRFDIPKGSGTHLKRLLHWFDDKPCKRCEAHAAEMDRSGPAWCRENIALIDSWLHAGAWERKWWVPRRFFYPLILVAISRAEARQP